MRMEDFMPRYNRVQSALEYLRIERSAESHRHGHIVQRTFRFHLVKEPESLLLERQRNRPSMTPWRNDVRGRRIPVPGFTAEQFLQQGLFRD